MPGPAGTPCDAPFWTRVLGFATDNGRFASNNAAGSRQWQRAGLLVTSRHGDDSPPERASGQQLDALAWAVARQRRQAGRQGMPRAVSAPPPPRQPDHARHAIMRSVCRQRADVIVSAEAAHVLPGK